MIQQIADLAITLSETANLHATVLKGIAEQYESLRSTLVDVAVDRDQEQGKRNVIEAMVDGADNLRAAADLIERGPVSAETLVAELYEALCLRAVDLTNASTARVCEVLKERANNIAMAYAGRVVREQE